MLSLAGVDAPQFELHGADMEMFSLEAQRGKKSIALYFFPKDDTPCCTMEATEFFGLDDNFIRFDTLVVGISCDECQNHAEFRDKYGLFVLLLPDTESMVCRKYKVLYGVHAHGHADEIFNLIKELK